MKSIRRSLVTGVTAALLLALGAGGGAVYLAVRDAHYDQFDAALRTKALVVITATGERNDRLRVNFSDRYLREFDDEVATSFFQVWDEDGRRIERSDSLERGELPRRGGSLRDPDYWNLDLPDGRPGRAVGIVFEVRADGETREATVVVATLRGPLDQVLARLRLILAVVGAAVIAIAAVVVPAVVGRGLRPLKSLGERADALNARRLTERFPSDNLPGELRPIVTRLNELLARLEVSFERERRFSSNLAHELLTPVAEIRTIAETALKWPDSAGPETQRHQLESALRMEALIGRLLELLRAEEGRGATTARPVDFDALLAEIWAELARPAEDRRIALEGPPSPGPAFEADPILLRSILHNLLANAVQHGASGARIRVAAGLREGMVEIAVTNSAPGLSRDDLPNLFERLWRKDEARSGGANHGLGLPLAREFAQIMGWNLEAALSDDGDLTLTLRGPQSAEESRRAAPG
jgi:two-component system sensor histidine kinase QseC